MRSNSKIDLSMNNVHNGPWGTSPVQGTPIAHGATPRYDAPMTDLTRQEVDAKLAQNKAEVDARLANFDTSIKTGFAEARAEAAELRADMHKMHAEIKSWTLATMITIIGTMLAAVFGVATIFNNANKPATATQAPQPVVIYAQPAPAPQAPAPAQPAAK